MSLTLFHGDNLDVLPTLEQRSVQCIVTSPPYFGLRDYQLPPSAWPDITYTPMAGLPSITIPEQAACLGNEATPAEYVAHLVHVFRLARQALKDDGVVWLNLGDCYARNGGAQGGGNREMLHMDGTQQRMCKVPADSGLKEKDLLGIPWMVAFALQADGWYLRSDVIWSKPNAMPESVKDRPTKAHEYVFLLAKNARYYYDAAAVAEPVKPESIQRAKYGLNTDRQRDYPGSAQTLRMGEGQQMVNPDGRNRRSVWTIPTQATSAAHFATMPEALAEVCIKAGSRAGDTVLDMYGGSGTTARVAERLSRQSIAIELNSDYISIHDDRTNGVQKVLLFEEAA